MLRDYIVEWKLGSSCNAEIVRDVIHEDAAFLSASEKIPVGATVTGVRLAPLRPIGNAACPMTGYDNF